MARHHLMGHSPKDVMALIERVNVVRIKNMDELKKLMRSLGNLVAESLATLVILDSIVCLLRENVSRSKEYYATLHGVAEKFTYVSKYYNIPILITNQIVHKNRSHDTFGTPLLGYLWSYCCNIKLMTHVVDATNGIYRMKVSKNPFSAKRLFYYTIRSSGLSPYVYDQRIDIPSTDNPSLFMNVHNSKNAPLSI